MAVGFLWDAKHCEELSVDEGHAIWPVESGRWLMKRERLLSKLWLR